MNVMFGDVTSSPDPSAGAVERHFTSAWNLAEEARASELFLDTTPEDVEQVPLLHVQEAARRLEVCGVDWTYQRLSVLAVKASGETLACRSGGVASDLVAEPHAGLIKELRRGEHEEALGWCILGLN